MKELNPNEEYSKFNLKIYRKLAKNTLNLWNNLTKFGALELAARSLRGSKFI
jgi:hypothetical protein